MAKIQGFSLSDFSNESLAKAIAMIQAGLWLDASKLSVGATGKVGLTAGGIATADLADDAVTLAKIQNIATNKLLGRSTASSGDVELIDCTAAGRAILDDADAAAQRTTLGLGTAALISSTAGGDLSGTLPSPTVAKVAGVTPGTLGLALLDDAAAANGRTTLGLGTIATQDANNVSVSGGSITGITDLAVADGGTGSSTAVGAQQALDVPGIITAARQSGTATGSGFQSVVSVTIPANTLGTTAGVRFDALFRRTTGSGNLTWRVGYGGTVMVTFTASTNATTRISGMLFADGATNAQRMHATESRVTASPVTGTAAVDSTAAANLLIEVDFATDADVVTCDWISVESLKP